jgi:hypothetical protein
VTGEDPPRKPRKGNAKDRRRAPYFAISIPERTVRSVLGTVGHTARELTHVLVPPAVRGTRFWNAAIERSLKILAEGVGRVPAKDPNEIRVDVARQAVGSVVDTAALLVFQVSPLWLLAVVYDVAKGSRRYLDEVVVELRARGALDPNVKIDGVDQLLTILERTAGELQSDVDRPPLSVEDLRSSVAEIRRAIETAPTGEIAADAGKVALELEETSAREGRTLREVSNAITVGAIAKARFAGRAAAAGVDVAKRNFVERGWRPYLEQLREVRKLGFYRYLANAAAPLQDALAANFDPRTDTLTAQLVSGRLWRDALARLQERGGLAGRAADRKARNSSGSPASDAADPKP